MGLLSKNYQIFVHELNKLLSCDSPFNLSQSFFPLFFEFLKKEIVNPENIDEKDLGKITSYFRRFFDPIIYGQGPVSLENIFILCSNRNEQWNLESIQYELLLANKGLNFFNSGVIDNANSVIDNCENFESENIIFICTSQMSDEKRKCNEIINGIINSLGPNQRLILVGSTDFSEVDLKNNNNIEFLFNIQGLDRFITYLCSTSFLS